MFKAKSLIFHFYSNVGSTVNNSILSINRITLHDEHYKQVFPYFVFSYRPGRISQKKRFGTTQIFPLLKYMIKFVIDLQQANGFLRFPPPIKPNQTIPLCF
jgi:hypothetical protein